MTALSASRRYNQRFIGVQYRSRSYVAYIYEPGTQRNIRIGTYPTAEEAARAYDTKALELRGRSAKTNFPVQWTDRCKSGPRRAPVKKKHFGRLCGHCCGMAHRRQRPRCHGCGEPYAREVIEVDLSLKNAGWPW